MKTSSSTPIMCLLLLCSACLLVGCGRPPRGDAQTESTTWKFAIEEIEGSVQDAYAKRFAELIESKTDGAIDVTVYPYGALGTSEQITQLARNGAIQFAMASPGHIGKTIPEVQVFLLHHVLSPDNDVNKDVLSYGSPVHQAFEPVYAEKGFQLLGFFPEGWMVWTTDRHIDAPEDMQGLKMRVMSSPLLVQSYKAYGANPTPMPYAEVYSGLQLKMIDGQVNPVFAIEEMSFYEVTDYMIFPRQAQFVASVVANKDFFDGLSPERRQVVEETLGELEDYIYDYQRRVNEERLDIIREKKPDMNMVELTEEQRAAFEALSEPVIGQFKDIAGARGAEILDLLEQEIAAREGETADASSAGGNDD